MITALSVEFGTFTTMATSKKQQQFIAKVGARIVEIRTKKGLTQTELADKCGWDKQNLRRIEIGEVNTTLRSIYIIAEALEVDPSDLF